MKKSITRRKIADDTRANIIDAARKLFAQSGFSGTTTQAIAKAAKVNETLIFHHFGNKAKLWKTIKANIVNSISLETLQTEPKSLRAFLETIINQRLSAHQQTPDLMRILQWQYMESKQSKISGGHILAPTNWLEPIKYLQKNGKINPNIKPEHIMTWLATNVNAVVFDHTGIFQGEDNRNVYLNFLLTSFERSL